MKIIVLFLTIVVMTLTIVPCSAFEVQEDHGTENVQNEKHECNENDADCCGDCSPFYVCCTCIGFTFSSPSVLTFAVQLKTVQHNTVYISIKPALISNVIWQPPKIA